jgi:hypothetical protein
MNGGSYNEIDVGIDPISGKSLVLRKVRGRKLESGALDVKEEVFRSARKEAAFASLLADLEIHPRISCWNVYEGHVVMEKMRYPTLSEAWTKEDLRDRIVESLVAKLATVAQLGVLLQDVKNRNIVVSGEGVVYFIDVDTAYVLFVDRFSGGRKCSSCRDAGFFVTFLYNFMLMQVLRTCRKTPSIEARLKSELRRGFPFLEVLDSFEEGYCDEKLTSMWQLYEKHLTIWEAWKLFEPAAERVGLLRTDMILPHFFGRVHDLSVTPSAAAQEMAERLNEYYSVFKKNRAPCPDSLAMVRLRKKARRDKLFVERRDVGPPDE